MTYAIIAASDIDYLENCRLPCIVKCLVDLKIEFTLHLINQGGIPP